MVMIRFKDPTTEVEGKSGGNVWRYDWCKQHIQAFPRMIDHEASPAQKARRRAFRSLRNLIRQLATIEWVATWQDYANRHPITNKKGEKIRLAWHCQFIKTNINRIIDNLPIFIIPPGY